MSGNLGGIPSRSPTYFPGQLRRTAAVKKRGLLWHANPAYPQQSSFFSKRPAISLCNPEPSFLFSIDRRHCFGRRFLLPLYSVFFHRGGKVLFHMMKPIPQFPDFIQGQSQGNPQDSKQESLERLVLEQQKTSDHATGQAYHAQHAV